MKVVDFLETHSSRGRCIKNASKSVALEILCVRSPCCHISRCSWGVNTALDAALSSAKFHFTFFPLHIHFPCILQHCRIALFTPYGTFFFIVLNTTFTNYRHGQEDGGEKDTPAFPFRSWVNRKPVKFYITSRSAPVRNQSHAIICVRTRYTARIT
jgi:hypothetical protein